MMMMKRGGAGVAPHMPFSFLCPVSCVRLHEHPR